MIKLGATCLVAMALALTACSEEPKTAPVAKKWTAAQQAEAEAAFPQEKLPAGAPPAPTTGMCMLDMCDINKVQFVRRDWPKAWQGDYQGQRNVAFCRSTGCDGAVELNKVEACAWRSIILIAHVGATDDTDTTNLKTDCGALDEAEGKVAAGTSKLLYEKIYGKPMPKV